MATGGPDSWEFAVAWDGATYVDESARLLADDGNAVTITRGGPDWATQPGVLSGALINHDGRFTPDNPLGVLRNAVPGPPTRLRIIKGASTYTRHLGNLTLSAPTFATEGDYTSSVVQFQAVDVLGRLMGVRMSAEFVERWRWSARINPVDIFALDASAADIPVGLSNLGSAAGVGRVLPAATRLGASAAVAPDGIMLDGAIELTAVNGSGPVVSLDLGASAAPVEIVVPFRSADRIRAGKQPRYIVQGLDADGGEEWSLRLLDNAGTTDMHFYDSSGGSALVYGGFAAAGDSELGDDQWFALRVLLDSGTQTFQLYRVIDQSVFFNSSSTGYDVGLTRRVILGGNLARRRDQIACTSTTFGAVAVKHAGGSSSHIGYLQPGAVEPAQTRVDDVRAYANLATSTITGTRNRLVTLRSTSGRSGFDVLAELALTTGGAALASRSVATTVAWRDSDVVRGPTVALSVDIEQDTGTALPWAKVAVPSRVTADHPAGSAVYEDPSRIRDDESIQTCAASDADALDVAAWRANSGRRLRLTSIVVDLAGAANDLWAATMALDVGDRVRTTLGTAASALAAQYGWTYLDHWVTGSVERYARDIAEIELQLMPADDPVEGVWDDADRGRWAADGTMTVTGGTAVGTTGTGTIVVTTAGGAPTWSTSAADYPLDVDWNGERCTVTTAPGGSSSPQTLTITARGVAPSIARAHSTGEPIDVWTGAAWTI